MDDFHNKPHAIVAEVDCDAHEDLCTTHGVEGFPSIKWGAAGDLQVC